MKTVKHVSTQNGFSQVYVLSSIPTHAVRAGRTWHFVRLAVILIDSKSKKLFCVPYFYVSCFSTPAFYTSWKYNILQLFDSGLDRTMILFTMTAGLAT